MKNSIMFLIIGMAGVFAMILAPTLIAAPADARITEQCRNTSSGGLVGGGGPCPGGSGDTPNKLEQNVNPQGKPPHGHNK